MAFRKYYTQEVTVAANATVQQFTLNTPDNWQIQTITELYSPTTTARWQFGLMVTGDQKLTVTAPRFTAGNEPVRFNVVVPAQTPPTLTIQDPTGTGASNINVTIAYEVNNE